MFKSATVKLTLIYIAILLCICAFFSFNWYTVATHELDEALHRQSSMVEMLPNVRGSAVVRDILAERETRLVEGKRNIARQLLGVNILLVLVGGLGGYFMAKRTLEPIEEAHQAQARFTADASHELRTPLAAMQTEIEVALRDPSLSKQEAIDLLESNLEELAKLTKLSDGLLQLARHGTDGRVAMVLVPLASVLTDVKNRTAKQAKARHIAVTYAPTTATVLGQQAGLVELFVNLVDNAVKYSPENATVEVRVTDTKQAVKVQVIDHGRGIKPTDLPRIFDRFYRADSSRTSASTEGHAVHGHGLGLSLAQQIARIHDTDIHVQSQYGEGSTFSVQLHKRHQATPVP